MKQVLSSGFTFLTRRLQAALGCAVLCALTIGAQPHHAQPLNPSIGKIEDALRARQFEDALQLSKRALEHDSRDPRIWTLQGIAYAGNARPALAFGAYKHALQLKANYLPALEGAAQIAYQQKYPAAGELLERVLRVRADDPNAHAMLGFIVAEKGDCSGAIEHFTHADQAIASQPLAHTRFGLCLAKMDRSAEAIEQFKMANALQSDDASHYNLALALWHAKRYDDAGQALQPVLQAGSTNEDILTLAADIDEALNNTPQAVVMLNRAIQSHPREVSGYLWLASLASNHSSFQVGIDMLNAGIRLMPQQGQLHLARGILFAQLGNFDSATEDFEAAHDLDPSLSFAGTAEGIIATQRHDLDASIERFRRQVEGHKGSAFDHYLLAESLRQKGADPASPEYAEALSAAKKAVELDPSLAIAHELLADIYLSGGDSAMAAQECEVVLNRDADNQEALYRLILALRKSDRKGEIPALTKRLVELRSAQTAHDAHVMTYELVDTAQPHAGPNGSVPARPQPPVQ